MENTAAPSTSIFRLFRALTSDTKTLIRQEIQLVRTEMSEKASHYGHNAISLAIGGAVAYAGMIVLLIGLGGLAAWALTKVGLEPMLAALTGLGGMGLIVLVIGAVVLLKAVKRFSRESLAPQRTIQTLHELKGAPQKVSLGAQQPLKKPSAEEMQARVENTEYRLSDTLDELGERLSPSHINQQVKAKLSANPYGAGALAAVAGLISGWMIRRRLRHA